MPIRPEMKDKYPPDWSEISKAARLRASEHCEQCGIANCLYGWRRKSGEFVPVSEEIRTVKAVAEVLAEFTSKALTRIVLTVHHLDEDPTNNQHGNLVALCQRCHLSKHRGRKHVEQDTAK